MKWLHQLRFLLRPFLGRNQVHRDVDDEIRFHLEMEAEKLISQGVAPSQARREARKRFGAVEDVKEEVRTVDGVGWMEKLMMDGRFGLRVLRKNPVFATVAILTLALGIGASTAIFSLVDGILLRPLPYPEPQELVTVWADLSERDGPRQEWLSYPNYEDAKESGPFQELGAYLEWQGTLTGRGPTRVVQGLRVSHGTISTVLGATPVLGRGFPPQDDVAGAPWTVLISYGLWNRLFGQNPEVVGQTMTLDGVPHEIIGVMPSGFVVPNLGGAFSTLVQNQEAWIPIQVTGNDQLGGRGAALFRTVGRLREGIGVEAARAQLEQLGRALEEEFPDANAGVGYALYPLQANMVEAQATGLWILLGAVGFILLLVCLNLANLFLARGSARSGEMALRSAMGAGRRRLIRQLVTESTVMALMGGLLGFVLAYLGTDLLVSLAPPGTPRLASVTVNGRILLFATVATVGSGILFGLFPALRVSSVDLRNDLAQSERNLDSGRGAKLRSTLVAGQMGVALVLLVGAGLLLRTFQELNRVDLGYEPQGVVTAMVSLNTDRYPEAEDRTAFTDELEERVAALPGVEAVGLVSTLPLSGFNNDVSFQVEGAPPPGPGEENISWIRRITPGYFGALGIPVLEGRGFSRADNQDQDSRVVMVNETIARRYFPGESAVGKRLNFNDPENPVWREVVGVVKNVKNFGIRGESPNATYFPYAQVPGTTFFITARTGLDDPTTLVPALREILGDMDSQLALSQVNTMRGMVSGALAQERFVALLLSVFAGVALLLAAVGLYGVVAYTVSRRTREMGLRIALGADGGRIGGQVVGRSMALAGGGMLAGLVGALFLTRLLEGILFGVSPTDPLTLALTALVLLAVSALAAGVPAFRASRVDPARVLKGD